MGKKLLRTIPFGLTGLKLRESAEGEEQSRLVEGHAVVFGVRSVNLTPWSPWREVYEVMEPGCITPELIKRSDVVLTAFHDNQKILGRSTNGKGTLTLSLDEKGLMQRCDWPKVTYADDLLVSLQRGDISGMSFAFEADEEDSENGVSYEHREDEDHDGMQVWVRHVKRVTGLYDVTVAGHPAYEQTDIAQREIDSFLDKHIGAQPETDEQRQQREADEKAKREAEEKAKREAEEKAKQEREHAIMMANQRERQRRMYQMREDYFDSL